MHRPAPSPAAHAFLSSIPLFVGVVLASLGAMLITRQWVAPALAPLVGKDPAPLLADPPPTEDQPGQQDTGKPADDAPRPVSEVTS